MLQIYILIDNAHFKSLLNNALMRGFYCQYSHELFHEIVDHGVGLAFKRISPIMTGIYTGISHMGCGMN